MKKYRFPKGMRPSKLKEREEFYREEFDVKSCKNWLSWRDDKNTAFAVIVGRHTDIYLPEYESVKRKALIIDEHSGLSEVLEYVLKYLPEGVYYDRNVYKNLKTCRSCPKEYRDCWDCENFLGQELAFDVDPENIPCPYHGTVEEKMKRHQGLSFCMIEFRRARKFAWKIYDDMKGEFKDVRMVYSGRGFHVHVVDKRALRLSREERVELAKAYSEYGIDEWVTNGEMRLIRLPYSLNGLVSRVCIPLSEEDKKFDPRYDARCIPRFLG